MRRGISALLRDYYRLRSRADDGEFDTAVMLTDLLNAVNGETLTARQRQFIALYYFVGLTYAEIAEVMRIEWSDNVSKGVYAALDRLNALYDIDDKSSNRRRTPNDFNHLDGAVYRWLDGIAEGEPVEEPPKEVVISIAEILKDFDDKSSELIRQTKDGYVPILFEEGEEEYPHFSDSQLRWLDRRMSFVPEVLPEGDVIGSKRTMPTYAVDDSGNGEDDDAHITRSIHRTGRRKLFKLRGN